jgi:uncharacterized membrane protein
MSDLVAVSFKGEDTAEQVLTKLAALQKEHLIDLEDACVVVRDPRRRANTPGGAHRRARRDVAL